MTSIRRLLPEDSTAWRDLRILALTNNPESFSSSLEEEINTTEAQIKDWLKKNTVLGAFHDQALVGTAGFLVFEGIKQSHRGLFFGMYVDPSQRGRGIGAQLVTAILEIAKKQVIQLHLAVVSTNDSAVRLYERYGFRRTGTDPRSLKIGEQFYDEDLMILQFDAS